MNEVINNILTRRSIRNFNDKKISKEDLELITKCGIYAPSARCSDLWHFSIINNKGMIDELLSILKELKSNDNYSFYNASALILISTPASYNFGIDDNACALENIFLASHSLNIGSVWINQLRDFNDNEMLRKFYNKLSIPSNHVIYGIAALGYYDDEIKPKERKGTYKYFA